MSIPILDFDFNQMSVSPAKEQALSPAAAIMKFIEPKIDWKHYASFIPENMAPGTIENNGRHFTKNSSKGVEA